jgi:hypothetical protein
VHVVTRPWAQALTEQRDRLAARPILGNGVAAQKAAAGEPQRTDFDRLGKAGAARRAYARPLTAAEEAGIARSVFNRTGTDAAERIAAHLAALVAQARAEGEGGE